MAILVIAIDRSVSTQICFQINFSCPHCHIVVKDKDTVTKHIQWVHEKVPCEQVRETVSSKFHHWMALIQNEKFLVFFDAILMLVRLYDNVTTKVTKIKSFF